MLSIPHRTRLMLVCCAVGAVASSSGGIFTFPILSPALVSHLKLTQPQLTTIVLAGVAGQYPFAVFVGKVVDTYGPWVCSLASAGLLSSGFGLFAWEIAKTPDDISLPSQSSFYRLTLFYFMCGLGTVFGLFTSLFAASKNFPQHLGFASGGSMAMFGLSPLFLTYVASGFYFSSETGLDVTSYVTFLAIYSGIVHVGAAMILCLPADEKAVVDAGPSAGAAPTLSDASSSSVPSERDSLLPKGAHIDVEIVDVQLKGSNDSAWNLVKDPDFWLLFFVTFAILGSVSTCEMVISNIGSITLSLPSVRTAGFVALDRETDIATSTQVRVISLSNTVARLVSGPLADFISPIASYLPSGVRSYPRKHWISRMAFTVGAGVLCVLGFLSLEIAIRSQASLWWLSVCTGTAYGVMFTVLPSILSAVWGADNLGRNFGIMSYAAFVGTPTFSYLYAFVAERHAERGVCTGVDCWTLTFWVVAGSVSASCLVSSLLWRRWRGLC
ncbi:MFS general substrate transporter [Vararia minispora EC-137]|uniref:MFS general substrate transporter n=1 Tax=Vararia minispora EC-137 TaxID=1314806 RepID=A0ACB8QW18_9AGAM|nr:MFS general substrate transporter [Vararia minispora EC-137]